MTRVTVVIPTHNRPQLLLETLTSVEQQTLQPDEVIVIDEASKPAVNEQILSKQFNLNIKVARNDTPHGLAWARNQGAELASGDIIAHLDDDDLFAHETLAEGTALLGNDPDLDLVFIGVEGFGERSQYFNRVQTEAVTGVLKRSNGIEIEPGVITLGQNLMYALLYSVPSAFQHVIVRREIWNEVSSLRRKAYCLDPTISDEDAAKHQIIGAMRDSEWALYASAICNKTALLNRPRYLARCEGQGLTSQAAQVEKHIQQRIGIKNTLYKAAQNIDQLKPWNEKIRSNLAKTYFDAAYHFFYSGTRHSSWNFLLMAIRLQPRLSHLKLALRMLIP